MQEYTSQETSKKIYEMFGWGSDTEKVWRYHKPNGASELKYRAEQESDNYRFRNNREAPRYRAENDFYPAYTLTYLLDKLPPTITDHVITMSYGNMGYVFGYMHSHAVTRNSKTLWAQRDFGAKGVAYTPVEAVALLCLELGEQGILPREDK